MHKDAKTRQQSGSREPPAQPGERLGISTASTRTLLRGLAIFECFSACHPTLSLHEICQRTDLAKATAFRLVRTLEAAGYLVRRGVQEYALSPRFSHLAAIAEGSLNLSNVAKPVLLKLAERSGHSATLHAISGSLRVCLDAAGRSPVLRTVHTTSPQPLSLGGASVVLLAFAAPVEQDELLDTATRNTGCSRAELLSIIRTVRKQGYFVSHGGGVAGITGISAPIYTGGVEASHSISIVLPTTASKGKVMELIALVRSASEYISSHFDSRGWRTPGADAAALH